jgi:hypothetical protein
MHHSSNVGSPRRAAAICLGIAFLLASCKTVAPVMDTANPTEFARNLFAIIEHGEIRQWKSQLSAERQAMGDAYAQKHFDFWKKNLFELKQTFGKPIEEVQFRVNENKLEFEFDNKWYKLIQVTTESGVLKMNQD